MTDDRRKFQRLWLDPTMTADRLANIFGCSVSTVFAWAKEMKLPSRTELKKGRTRPDTWKIQDIETFHEMWHNPDLTGADIARHFGVNNHTVSITGARLGYQKRYKIRTPKSKENGKWELKNCEYCSQQPWCQSHPHAYKLPCEKEGTPYVDGRERITLYQTPLRGTITVSGEMV